MQRLERPHEKTTRTRLLFVRVQANIRQPIEYRCDRFLHFRTRKPSADTGARPPVECQMVLNDAPAQVRLSRALVMIRVTIRGGMEQYQGITRLHRRTSQ